MELERDRAFDQIFLSDEERKAVTDLYNTKLEKLINEQLQASNERTKELVAEAEDILASKDLSPYDAEINKIREWETQALNSVQRYISILGRKDEFVKESAAIVANALAKETAAFEEEIDRIRGKTQSLAEKIFEQQNSQRNIDIMRAQKQRAEYYNEGVYPDEMIEEWYQGELSRIADRVKKDKDLSYRTRPKNYRENAEYIDAFIPDDYFYGDIQDRVNQALSQAGSPGYELQQRHAEMQEQIANKFADATTQFADVTDRLNQVVESAGTLQGEAHAPTITVTVSPSIDLGGAYVFDDAMKQRLAEDVSNEVVQVVTDAFQEAVGQAGYSFGN